MTIWPTFQQKTEIILCNFHNNNTILKREIKKKHNTQKSIQLSKAIQFILMLVREWVCSSKQFVLIISSLCHSFSLFITIHLNYLMPPLQCKQCVAVAVAETWINRENEIKWEIIKKVKMKVCIFIFIYMQRHSTNICIYVRGVYWESVLRLCWWLWHMNMCARANKAKQSNRFWEVLRKQQSKQRLATFFVVTTVAVAVHFVRSYIYSVGCNCVWWCCFVKTFFFHL